MTTMNEAELEAASAVCRTIVDTSLLIAPVIVAHLDGLTMDTPEDQALVTKLQDMVRPWFEACYNFDLLIGAVRDRVADAR